MGSGTTRVHKVSVRRHEGLITRQQLGVSKKAYHVSRFSELL